MPRQTTVPFPAHKFYIKRDLCNGDQIDTSSPYIENGKIYRDIDKHPTLKEIVRTGFSKELAMKGYLPYHHVDFEHPTRIQVEFLPWCVYATEHSLRQSRDGLLRMLELVILLNQRGLTLRDISYGQVVMRYSSLPMLIDLGSIYQPVSTYKNLVMKEMRTWAHQIGMTTRSNDIKGLLKEVEGYYPKSPRNEWDSYDLSDKTDLISIDHPEIRWIQRWLEETRCSNAIDAGANRGRIAKHLACRMNMPVLACDTSDFCVTDLYLWAQKNHMPITSLKWDIMVPPQWLGYEWVMADAVIASSLTHHLYRAGHNFVEQEKVFRQLARRLILVEYIDPKDRHVGRWGVKWTRQEFEDAFKEYTLLDRISLDELNPHRFWYAYEVCGV